MKRILTILSVIFALGCIICFSPTLDAQVQQPKSRRPANSGQLGGNKPKNRTKNKSQKTTCDAVDRKVKPKTVYIGRTKKETQQFYFPGKVKSAPTRNKYINDTIHFEKTKNDKPMYYARITRKNGWFVGVGKPLTEAQASHRSVYYKLSHKNKAGNWTFVEAFDGYGNPTTPDIRISYLTNPRNFWGTGSSTQWTAPLQNVCKWAFYADVSGKTVVQEIAMGADGSTVFVFTPTKIGEKEYLGTYTDKWGQPLFLMPFEEYEEEFDEDSKEQPSRVLITRDKDGHDELINYIDDKGAPQKNIDGVFMIQLGYDNEGREISEVSLNFAKERMINNKGYCEWIASFKNNSSVEFQYLDADGMPNPIIKDIYITGSRIYRDEYGRDTTIMYIYSDEYLDDISCRVNIIKKNYNEYGQLVSCIYLDDNNKLCPINEEGIAQCFYQYDSYGRLVMQEFKNKRNNYIYFYADNETDDSFCRQEIEYKSDDDNTVIHKIEYSPDHSDKKKLEKDFEYILDDKGNATSKWFIKGHERQKVELVDSLLRPTLTAWYDFDNHPIDGFDDEPHKHIITYDDKNNTKTELWLDTNGLPCYDDDDYYDDHDRNYSKLVTITDSISDSAYHSIKKFMYQGDTMICAFERIIDSQTGFVIQQNDLTTYGDVARVGWFDKLYYKCSIKNSFNGRWRAYFGHNEFGEPSYMRRIDESEKVFYIHEETGRPLFLKAPCDERAEEEEDEYDLFSNDNYDRNYDEYCNEIDDYEMDDFIKQLPRAFCIEVTDTTKAQKYGFKNGDIIISYGDWIASNNLNTNMDCFYLETILKADTTKKLTLLRHHPEQKSSEIVSTMLPVGKASDLGFYPHKIYYTQNEAKRLKETCSRYNVSLSSSDAESDTTILLAVQQKGSPRTTSLYYAKENANKDAGILLYVSLDDDVWSIIKNTPEISNIPFSSYNDERIILSHNMKGICVLSEVSPFGNLEIIPLKVTKSLFKRIQDLYNIHHFDKLQKKIKRPEIL